MKTAVLIEKKLSRMGNPQYFFKIIYTDEADGLADDDTYLFCKFYGIKYTLKGLGKIETYEGFKQYFKNYFPNTINCVIE